MQKIATAILSVFILAQSFNVSFGDFLHIDDLIAHYEYHQETFGDTIITFIDKHYGELKSEHNREHQEEREDHEKLPFEHQHSCVHSVVAFFNQNDLEVIPKIIPADQVSSNFEYHNSYSHAVDSSIFQPPKNA
ncbi:hypothetical protein [Leeuwenhoekiella sp. W20_SRS_FM14]|uniref:hypothetical protein n=1 Tax=Leeuwenhoekiella sp. W20_SRS_FM14 TaxID=3240270 RepID=UPI003F9B8652